MNVTNVDLVISTKFALTSKKITNNADCGLLLRRFTTTLLKGIAQVSNASSNKKGNDGEEIETVVSGHFANLKTFLLYLYKLFLF
mmetsp:Transcript_32730/g.29614  ORF Transcript_32730/g.29614 Transcript_32730/m.29614 type:complete len:85 (+) Transcript_32730:1079-1333(+)